MIVNVLTLTFLVLSGLLAGVLFAVQIAIVPTITALPGDRWVQVHILLDGRFDPLMPRINKVALAICVALVVLAHGVGARVAFACAGLCIVGVAYVSEFYNVRMNHDIASWDPGRLPDHWSATRATWASANLVRAVVAVAGFVGAGIGGALAFT